MDDRWKEDGFEISIDVSERNKCNFPFRNADPILTLKQNE